MKMSIISSH